MLENIVRNDIPIYSLYLETIVAIELIVLTVVIIRKYLERRRPAAFYLSGAILFYGLGILVSAAGKYLDFFNDVPQSVISYSGFAINLAYAFSAIANAFLYNFVEFVYLSNKEWRMIVFATLNGITVGWIMDVNSFEFGVYSRIFPIVVYHVLLSFFVNSLLAYQSFKTSNRTKDDVARWGFRFIGLFGVFLNLVFIFFGLDNFKIITAGTTFNLEYYLAWISAAIGTIFGSLGYLMPEWLKRRIEGGRSS